MALRAAVRRTKAFLGLSSELSYSGVILIGPTAPEGSLWNPLDAIEVQPLDDIGAPGSPSKIPPLDPH